MGAVIDMYAANEHFYRATLFIVAIGHMIPLQDESYYCQYYKDYNKPLCNVH
jgi:hypothetical protein